DASGVRRDTGRVLPRPSTRDLLRSLPALTGGLPDFDPYAVSVDPAEAFVDWLGVAIEAGVPEPHAMTVATVGADGVPASRIVLLTDVTEGSWRFATDARTGKARDLAADPRVAASFYWQRLGRQVRLVGRAELLDPEFCAADFRSRAPSSRAAAVASRPGEQLDSVTDMADAVVAARARVDRDPRLVVPTWQVWAIVPDEVELWQGDSDRAHMRLVYRREQDRWDRRLWWP
ncbi:MAG TPA: pyridoxal 5'-phosphate synthase, partial [Cellulomonas sp.]